MLSFARVGAAPGRWAPLIYLLIALPVILFQTLAVPPFQNADEDNHFLRAVAISRGALVGTRFSDVSAGGPVDAVAVRMAHALDGLKFHPERRATAGALEALRRESWRPTVMVPADFGNTVIYPPWFYLPAVAGVLAGRLARAPAVDGLLLARLATGLATALAGALAIALAGRGRAVIFAVLALPMSLALAGDCSQDGPAIAAAALAAALLGREGFRPLLASGFLLGLVVAAKPPYAPLLLLGLAAVAARPGGTSAREALLLAGAVLLPLLWIPLGVAPLRIMLRSGDGVSAAGQVGFALAHPGAALTAMFSGGFLDYGREMLGVLGWLDTPLPATAYRLAGLSLLAALALALVSPAPARARWLAPAMLLALPLTALAVIVALYLTWTPVGARVVEGVQGRYFLPVAICAGLALPALVVAPARLRTGLWLVLYGSAATTLWYVPMTVMVRYYG